MLRWFWALLLTPLQQRLIGKRAIPSEHEVWSGYSLGQGTLTVGSLIAIPTTKSSMAKDIDLI